MTAQTGLKKFPLTEQFTLEAELRKLIEEQNVRQAHYYSKTRTIFLNEDALNIIIHERPHMAAERMRALAVYLQISAECLEVIAEAKQRLQKGQYAEPNPDSSSS